MPNFQHSGLKTPVENVFPMSYRMRNFQATVCPENSSEPPPSNTKPESISICKTFPQNLTNQSTQTAEKTTEQNMNRIDSPSCDITKKNKQNDKSSNLDGHGTLPTKLSPRKIPNRCQVRPSCGNNSNSEPQPLCHKNPKVIFDQQQAQHQESTHDQAGLAPPNSEVRTDSPKESNLQRPQLYKPPDFLNTYQEVFQHEPVPHLNQQNIPQKTYQQTEHHIQNSNPHNVHHISLENRCGSSSLHSVREESQPNTHSSHSQQNEQFYQQYQQNFHNQSVHEPSNSEVPNYYLPKSKQNEIRTQQRSPQNQNIFKHSQHCPFNQRPQVQTTGQTQDTSKGEQQPQQSRQIPLEYIPQFTLPPAVHQDTPRGEQQSQQPRQIPLQYIPLVALPQTVHQDTTGGEQQSQQPRQIPLQYIPQVAFPQAVHQDTSRGEQQPRQIPLQYIPQIAIPQAVHQGTPGGEHQSQQSRQTPLHYTPQVAFPQAVHQDTSGGEQQSRQPRQIPLQYIPQVALPQAVHQDTPGSKQQSQQPRQIPLQYIPQVVSPQAVHQDTPGSEQQSQQSRQIPLQYIPQVVLPQAVHQDTSGGEQQPRQIPLQYIPQVALPQVFHHHSLQQFAFLPQVHGLRFPLLPSQMMSPQPQPVPCPPYQPIQRHNGEYQQMNYSRCNTQPYLQDTLVPQGAQCPTHMLPSFTNPVQNLNRRPTELPSILHIEAIPICIDLPKVIDYDPSMSSDSVNSSEKNIISDSEKRLPVPNIIIERSASVTSQSTVVITPKDSETEENPHNIPKICQQEQKVSSSARKSCAKAKGANGCNDRPSTNRPIDSNIPVNLSELVSFRRPKREPNKSPDSTITPIKSSRISGDKTESNESFVNEEVDKMMPSVKQKCRRNDSPIFSTDVKTSSHSSLNEVNRSISDKPGCSGVKYMKKTTKKVQNKDN